MEQYYELLGLSIGATIPEINASFRRLSLKLRPDKNTNNPEATINFQKLSEARNVLVKQKEYEEKTNKIWKENLKKQQAEQETFQNKQKEEILAKQKFKIFKKEIDQKMKKNYIELLPKILDFKIELKKLEKELLTLQSKSSKLRKSIINLNTKKINPRINFYIKCITLGFYDWNKITEKELCENKNEFIKTNREKENLKEKYDIVKTNMQILINEQNLLQEDLKELFAKENDLKKYINSFNLEEKDSIRDWNKYFSSSV